MSHKAGMTVSTHVPRVGPRPDRGRGGGGGEESVGKILSVEVSPYCGGKLPRRVWIQNCQKSLLSSLQNGFNIALSSPISISDSLCIHKVLCTLVYMQIPS